MMIVLETVISIISEKKTKELFVTLQPLRTSIPMTCPKKKIPASKFVLSEKNTSVLKIHNTILCLVSYSYREVLLDLVRDSILNLTILFEDEKLTEQVNTLRDTVEQSSHTVLCVAFLLLLNIDMQLKEKIIEMDSEHNMRKVTRFLLDLRTTLAVRFFTDETYTINRFLEDTVDCYIIS